MCKTLDQGKQNIDRKKNLGLIIFMKEGLFEKEK